MEVISRWGANYLVTPVEENVDTKIIKQNIYFGETLIYPGIKIKKIGRKKRDSFEMSTGHFLMYQGTIQIDNINYSVFKPKNADDLIDENEYRYVFALTSIPKPEKLLIFNQIGNGSHDIDCSYVEEFGENFVQLKFAL